MILKTLSVFAISAAVGVAAASPISAQRNSAGQSQSGKAQAVKPSDAKAPPPSRPKPWWSDDTSKKALGLTAAQVKAIDDIYNSSKDELASYRENTDRERKELDRLIAESKVEQWVVLRHIDKVETQRSSYNKTWFMMLYRMRRQLTVDQRAKLEQILERERRGGREGMAPGRRDPKPAR
jgi:Spy/CpxP family protein refolding chaperone